MRFKATPKIRRDISSFTSGRYYDAIPLGAIDNALRIHGARLQQEDGEAWEGFLCGREGNALFRIGVEVDGKWHEVTNTRLSLSWYKREKASGGHDYEIVCYLS